MHRLFHYINSYLSTSISREDYKVIKSHFIRKKLNKKQLLLQRGDICNHFAFIVKGALRQYYIDKKGTEYTVNLYIENWWAGDRESFIRFTPSMYTIVAMEDCEVLLITREAMLKLCHQYPAFNELFIQLNEKNSIAVERRIASIGFTAEKRYRYFVKNYSFFINRFPQHYIASYLGISKDTLSRLRRQIEL